MEARKRQALHLAKALTEDYAAATDRHTPMKVSEWKEEFKRRLVSDIERGQLNPDKWFLMNHINQIATRYGLSREDDLVISMVPIEILQSYHDIPTPAMPEMGRVAKYRMAARLNPDKYGHLASIYKSKAMRRLV